MKVNILTLFPNLFSGFLDEALIGKAIINRAIIKDTKEGNQNSKNLVDVQLTQIRDFAEPPHYKVDDTPYGGGPGMVMKPEPIVLAVEEAKKKLPNAHVILTSATGKIFNQQKALELATNHKELIFICGRYEGVDARVNELVVDEEISIGEYVLMGGEVATMVILEAVFRLLPNFIGNPESVKDDSYSKVKDVVTQNGSEENNAVTTYREHPHYTKPHIFRELKVPEVLLSGDHKKIAKWREHKN